MNQSAFVGVSLDSNQFSRTWVRGAISHILSKHADLQFVLADRLLTYNKTIHRDNGSSTLDFLSASERIEKRKKDIFQFLTSEISRLPGEDRPRVHVATWDDYSDVYYANLSRALRIAYIALPAFRLCVEYDVEAHLIKHVGRHDEGEIDRSLCASYVLDETAMIIRVTELAKKPFDYYPQEQIETLQCLYEGRFSAIGLSVEGLLGHPKTRVFSALRLPDRSPSEAVEVDLKLL